MPSVIKAMLTQFCGHSLQESSPTPKHPKIIIVKHCRKLNFLVTSHSFAVSANARKFRSRDYHETIIYISIFAQEKLYSKILHNDCDKRI